MPFTLSVSGDASIISSSNCLTIEAVDDFARIIREAFDRTTHILIEFDPLLEIDITGLQILCSACKSAAACGKTFSYRGALPQTLTDIISRSGAERHPVCKQNNNSTCIWFGGAN